MDEFNKFISEFSDYIGTEISGVQLGDKSSTKATEVRTRGYKGNTRTKSYTPRDWLSSKVWQERGLDLKAFFHTHPYNDHKPSADDLEVKEKFPNLRLIIISSGYGEDY